MHIDTAIVDAPILPGAGESVDLPPQSGARVTFTGCVRNHDEGQGVTHLEYSAHPQAAQFLRRATDEAVAGFPVDSVYVRHRVGHLEIGDIALLVIVDSAHRREAFEAAMTIVDTIKAQVPIWKDQYFTDGSHEWSNCP